MTENAKEIVRIALESETTKIRKEIKKEILAVQEILKISTQQDIKDLFTEMTTCKGVIGPREEFKDLTHFIKKFHG